MKNSRRLNFLIILFITFFAKTEPPKLTIVFVIDGFANYVIPHIKPYLHGGIKYLLDNGIVYTNAYQPHGMPATTPGHSGISTGTYPQNHGLVANKWFDENGKKVIPDQDSVEQAAVFSKNGLYEYGRSAHMLMTDGISDQFILQGNPTKKNYVYAISGKSRASIPLANKLGKAIWFDYNEGRMTSSKAYFEKLPLWIENLNKKYENKLHSLVSWKTVYAESSPAYAFAKSKNYKHSREKKRVNTTKKINNEKKPKKKYKSFIHMPEGQEMFLDYGYACLEETFFKDPNNSTMLLWIGISGPDRTAHIFGPESIEYIDMLYHIDKQINKFLEKVYKKLDKKDIAIAFTADHGMTPIIENLHKQGFNAAYRINSTTLVSKINKNIEKQLGIKNLILKIKTPSVYINEVLFAKLSKDKQDQIHKIVKILLKKEKGIKEVWTINELKKLSCNKQDLAYLFKKQLYGERNGHFIIQVLPFTYISTYNAGSGHKTPYEYDTHVPLILYYPGLYDKKTITKKVWVPQITATLAQIINIPKPSACVFNPLPLNKK